MFYLKIYNVFSSLKNFKIAKFREKENEKQLFIKNRDTYQNENLSDLVKNGNEMNKIIEFEGILVQKSDPIYRDAQGFRAHFFAPTKKVLGKSVNTFWVNIMVILGMALTLFIALYFDALKKLIDWLGKASTKIGLSKEE